MRKITNVRVLEGYCLELTFDDGVCGKADLSGMAGQGVFALWCQPQAFQSVRIGSSGELVWGDQVDLCPESLYLKVTGKKPEEVFPALRHDPSYA